MKNKTFEIEDAIYDRNPIRGIMKVSEILKMLENLEGEFNNNDRD